MNTTWRILITEIAKKCDDDFEDLAISFSSNQVEIAETAGIKKSHDELLDEVFNQVVGSFKGTPWCAWSENYIYFPVIYNDSVYASALPRNPEEGNNWYFFQGCRNL